MAVSERVLRGVLYAFTRGMDPRLKDGVRAHPWVLVTGVVFHAGIGAGLASFLSALGLLSYPAGVRMALMVLALAGSVAGLVLLARRVREPVLKAISGPDDYISNLLVVAVLVACLAFLLAPQLKPLFVALSAALVVYAPFGKIRHCVLFFVARARYGAFIGTRGVLIGSRRR
jgi:hypothetical protein